MRWGVGFSILYPSSDLNIMYVGYSAAGPERWIRGGEWVAGPQQQ
jgi:hypothetical protein